MHQHDHQHHHAIDAGKVSRKLVVSAAFTVLFVFVEFGFGIYSNSLSLISEGFHNFTDTLALLLALSAIVLEKKPATAAKSFGYLRAGVLAAFVNAGALVAFTIFIFVEAWERYRNPEPVDSLSMMVVAAVSFVLNLGITLWLRHEGKHDVNIRSAALHMFGDAVSSIGIVIAAVLIRVTGDTIYDPMISILIGILILWSSWGILRETVNLLLEGTPAGFDPEAVTAAIDAEEGVLGVHHLHIWALGPSRPALSCHIIMGDVTLKEASEILARVNEMLTTKYHIAHTTIQVEHAGCPEDNPYCVLPQTR